MRVRRPLSASSQSRTRTKGNLQLQSNRTSSSISSQRDKQSRRKTASLSNRSRGLAHNTHAHRALIKRLRGHRDPKTVQGARRARAPEVYRRKKSSIQMRATSISSTWIWYTVEMASGSAPVRAAHRPRRWLNTSAWTSSIRISVQRDKPYTSRSAAGLFRRMSWSWHEP